MGYLCCKQLAAYNKKRIPNLKLLIYFCFFCHALASFGKDLVDNLFILQITKTVCSVDIYFLLSLNAVLLFLVIVDFISKGVYDFYLRKFIYSTAKFTYPEMVSKYHLIKPTTLTN